MTKYTATFEDGVTITRKTKREYAFAWRANYISLDGHNVTETGFSATKELAEKASNVGLPYGTWRGMSSKHRALANEKNAQFLQTCNMKIEIVPAIAN